MITWPANLLTWNTALFNAVFSPSVARSGAVRRINVTDAFIASAIGCAAEDGAAAREALVGTIRRAYPWGRDLFSLYPNLRGWDPTATIPPFFANLYVSLLVASATEDTWQEGNFRRRLAAVLKQPESRDLVDPGLPRLWETLRKWLTTPSAKLQGYRELELPPLGAEVIIGYSKQLAFPGHRDSNRLAEVISAAELDTSSPVQTILRHIGAARARFSVRLQAEFDEFGRLVRTDRIAALRTPFWDAFAEISWSPATNRVGTGSASLGLELGDVLRPELLLLTRTTELREPRPAIRALRGVDGFGAAETRSDAWAVLTATTDTWRSRVSGPIRTAMQSGCLCFSPGDEISWVWTRTLPDVGPVWFVARSTTAAALNAAALDADLPRIDTVPITGCDWHLVGRFLYDQSSRERFVSALPGGLGGLELFKRALVAPRIHFFDTVRLPEGILTLRPRPPRISAAGATRVTLSPIGTGATSIEGTVFTSIGEGLFELDVPTVADLEFPVEVDITSWSGESSLASTRRTLIRTHSASPLPPSQPDAWLKEGDAGRLEPLRERAPSVDVTGAQPAGRTPVAIAKTQPTRVQHPETELVWVPLRTGMPAAWDDLLEVITGMTSTRQGIEWGEFADILDAGLDCPNSRRSQVADLLLENGLVQQLFRRAWRESRFFTGPLSASIDRRADETQLRIVGGTSRTLRSLIDAEARAAGSSAELAATDDGSAIGAIRIVGITESDALRVCSDLSIPVERAPAGGSEFPPPQRILRPDSLTTPPRGVESRWYDRDLLRFVPNRVTGESMSLERRSFANGPSSFLLHDGNEIVWQTNSYRWAVLITLAVTGALSWDTTSGGALLTPVPLPRPAADEVLRRGAGVVDLSAGRRGAAAYRYTYTDTAAVARFFSHWMKEGSVPRSSDAMARWANAMSSSLSAGLSKHIELRYGDPSAVD